MARAAKLKVYRTPIGFHDAYVAAASQKAALQAWGSDKDLFARGVAELVTDPALTAEPLARPGEVVRRSRGTVAEQIAALPETPARARRSPAAPDAPDPAPPRSRRNPPPRPIPPPPAPRPDRAPVIAAERALADAEARHRRDDRALRVEEEALAKRRAAMARDQDAERERLEQARRDAAARYDAAMRAWQG